MNKNKILNIKFVFKTYLKILKYVKNILSFQIDFYCTKIKEQFLKNIFQNCFRK